MLLHWDRIIYTVTLLKDPLALTFKVRTTMASSTQRVDIGNTLGALFIGVILGAVSVKYPLTVQSLHCRNIRGTGSSV
jgi:hypothetical protein